MSQAFEPHSWIQGAEQMDGLREDWEQGTHAAKEARSSFFGGLSPSKIDKQIKSSSEEIFVDWYDRIGEVGVRMGSDASKMHATGTDYASTEDEAVAANERFWE